MTNEQALAYIYAELRKHMTYELTLIDPPEGYESIWPVIEQADHASERINSDTD